MEQYAGEVRTATVRSYRESKFGFAELENGTKVYFSAKRLKKKFRAPKPGDRITGVGKHRERGVAFTEIHEIERNRDSAPKKQEAEGLVKFYKYGKGYGYITLEDGADIFFHATVARECGIEPETLMPGLVVSVTYQNGRKGPRVERMALNG